METTERLWVKQDRHPGDRARLCRAVGQQVQVDRALYPGSYVDLAASFVFPNVTYVDVDRRATSFFADEDGVRAIVGRQADPPAHPQIRFIASDYAVPLAVPDGSMDLLISLYAGLISASCTRYLRIGGTLLVNPSHGDAAMASIDPRYQLAGAIQSNRGEYQVRTDALSGHLVPKAGVEVTAEAIRALGRGITCTKRAFAYLFTRIR